MIPAYVINLDRSPERLEEFMAEARRVGVAVERFAAIDARTLPDPIPGQAFPDWVRSGHRGHTAAVLSHVSVWRLIAKGDAPWGAVFEDDAVFSLSLSAYLDDTGWVPPGIGLVKLDTIGDREFFGLGGLPAPAGRRLRRVVSRHLGAAGYLISRDAARQLVDQADPLRMPIDHLLFGYEAHRQHRLRFLQVDPALCIQRQFAPAAPVNSAATVSTIDYQTVATAPPRLRPAAKLAREAARLAAQLGWIARGGIRRTIAFADATGAAPPQGAGRSDL
ncbi:glycosyltransferase family 25 protein [Prosthecomicrobium pneumaticum]|uniref:Glycosyl transferase family 25 n=1 Tax=Prosthecomicrobium pneumaticum TaxID=81895 RepID=A0A7W9CT69_9HYPH|nr:glycosyltransferase family 25 protein [Prosthecomicrobium pneumaticum]MBB5751478.1 glycosyl transferase family 25 [Prosthecomicrobium pneumaticum]